MEKTTKITPIHLKTVEAQGAMRGFLAATELLCPNMTPEESVRAALEVFRPCWKIDTNQEPDKLKRTYEVYGPKEKCRPVEEITNNRIR